MYEPDYSRKCTSIYRGIVENNEDPQKIGRCKVRVPSIHGELNYPVEILPWSRPIVLSPIKSGKGSVNIPDVGDIVWVVFEGSSKDYPLYFGGSYAKDEIDVNNDRVIFYTEHGDVIYYERSTRTYVVQVGGSRVSITEKGIDIKGNVNISGDLKVSGHSDLNKVTVGSCNKECRC